MKASRGVLTVALSLGLVAGLSACGTVSRVIGGDDDTPQASTQVGIGVNGHLWRVSSDLENAILTRARQLRLAGAGD